MTYKAIIVVVPVIAVLLSVIPTTIFAQNDNSQQQTCPDGSQPDSNGNCPPQQQQQQPTCSDGSQPDSNGNCSTNNPQQQQQPACSDGSTPDSNGNCPSSNSQPQSSSHTSLGDKVCALVNSGAVVALALVLHLPTGGATGTILAAGQAYCGLHGLMK